MRTRGEVMRGASSMRVMIMGKRAMGRSGLALATHTIARNIDREWHRQLCPALKFRSLALTLDH